MFISTPISTFKLKDNKLTVNDNVFEFYQPISEDHKEILESLISKGAYGSALLTINKFYDLKKINESKCTTKDIMTYITECSKLMKECVFETEARDFRPLINLGGLEIMENANHIARGKGSKLLIEDFRDGYIESTPADYVVDAIDAGILDAKEVATAALKWTTSDDVIEMIKANDWYVPGFNDNEYDDEDNMNEECEGTQCSDIAEKKDQEVGSLQKPSKPKKHFTEMFNIPKNHGFKGFRLDERGHYTRGSYVLINENGSIKAINKKLVEANIDLLYKTLHLDQDLEKAMVEGASKVLYIDEDEVKDYCSIKFEEDEDNNYVRVYFLAEVDYMDGTKIVDEYLDGVITKYDKDAYFEAETSGRWVALVRKECLN